LLSQTQLRLHAITDPLGTPTRVTTTLAVPSYRYPEDPPQMGTSNRPELFEARFWSCVYRNGSLWAVHHQDPSRVRVRWYEIAMNDWPVGGTPTLVQSGEIDPGTPVRTFFPSIWVDDLGNAMITCARSSPDEFISMCRATRLAGDAPGTFGTLEFVRQSAAAYTIYDRWGDYSGTGSDPATPGKFWGIHEYAPFGTSWNTWFVEVQLDLPEPCPGDLDADGVRDLTDFTLFANAYGSVMGDANYNPDADMDGDGVIDLTDFTQFAAVYGVPCP
jgi:hypothetical protein